jgi:hypothetical protein
MTLPILGKKMRDSEKYKMLIGSTVQQMTACNQMLEVVKTQSAAATEANDLPALEKHERLMMHIDNKAVMLMAIVATYECAYQQAIINERSAGLILA